MLAFTLLAAVAALSPAVAQDACSASPYSKLLCLPSSDKSAASACSSLPVQTVTSTVTTTTLSQATLSTSENAPSQTTVTSTNTQVETVYITSGPTTTMTSVFTDVSTFNTTITTYVSTMNTCTDELSTSEYAVPVPASTACNSNGALSALQSFSGDQLATGCSCAGYPAQTTTSTLIITASPVPTTTTLVAGLAPTTTAFAITVFTATLTVAPTTTMHLTTCTSTTSTETISYAAPTYTHVFGPRAGCIDVAKGPGKALNAAIKDDHRAMLECIRFCNQEPSCAFLYVQRLLVDYGSAQPFFQCFAHDGNFTESNLECGAMENIYGLAEGFNALHRGIKPL